jgi:cleavage and polyadenylation specificity factor subunit 6/7
VVGNGSAIGGGDGPDSTTLFVGELHWWTADADLEAKLNKYGPVKEVRFFDEKANDKSKGYCQVDFYDPAVATTCKEGMNEHLFYGRPCVVAFALPNTVRRMGEAQVKNQQAMAA